MLKPPLIILAALVLVAGAVQQARGLVITEFLAENDGGLRDADGESPDWIEIRNDSAVPVNLAGWHLTDDPAALSKWTFPALELTYNWGVASYELGTAYGHVALGVDDIHATCDRIRAAGGKITREPGPMKHGTTVIAFLVDPDGYKVELIEEGSRSR